MYSKVLYISIDIETFEQCQFILLRVYEIRVNLFNLILDESS